MKKNYHLGNNILYFEKLLIILDVQIISKK